MGIIWDFGNGITYRSFFQVVDFGSKNANDIQKIVTNLYPNTLILDIDPLDIAMKSYKQAAEAMKSDRGKKVFLDSAIKRHESLGKACLVEIDLNALKCLIVGTRAWVAILGPDNVKNIDTISDIAYSITKKLEGTLVKLN